MLYFFITNDIELAKLAVDAGVERIFIDLESLGKFDRQGHLNTFISSHTIEDVAKIKRANLDCELLVRLNPLNDNTQQEIENVLSIGADYLMLPMFRTAEEVAEFSSLVAGRAGVIPLVETYCATQVLNDVLKIEGVSEIYIGLNDLRIDMGAKFLFEPIASGFLDEMTSLIKAHNKPFGFGGIARIGEGLIPAERILLEHVRMGSTRVILSRTFHRPDPQSIELHEDAVFSSELSKLNSRLANAEEMSEDVLLQNHQQIKSMIDKIVSGDVK